MGWFLQFQTRGFYAQLYVISLSLHQITCLGLVSLSSLATERDPSKTHETVPFNGKYRQMSPHLALGVCVLQAVLIEQSV